MPKALDDLPLPEPVSTISRPPRSFLVARSARRSCLHDLHLLRMQQVALGLRSCRALPQRRGEPAPLIAAVRAARSAASVASKSNGRTRIPAASKLREPLARIRCARQAKQRRAADDLEAAAREQAIEALRSFLQRPRVRDRSSAGRRTRPVPPRCASLDTGHSPISPTNRGSERRRGDDEAESHAGQAEELAERAQHDQPRCASQYRLRPPRSRPARHRRTLHRRSASRRAALSESCSSSSRARSTMRPSGLLGLTIVRHTARSACERSFVEPDRLRQRAGTRPRVGVRSVRRSDDNRRFQTHAAAAAAAARIQCPRSRRHARDRRHRTLAAASRFETRELRRFRQPIACSAAKRVVRDRSAD